MLEGVLTTRWDDFVGQEKAKKILKASCVSAKARNVPLPHTLLTSGVPGLGKTSIALLAAQEMGTELKILSGKLTVKDVRSTLRDMEDNSILLIDEFHTLFTGGKAASEQWLLHLMENNTIIGPYGPELVAKITVMGTTTDEGKIPGTVISRFPCIPVLEPYTEDEATEIAFGMGYRIFKDILTPPNFVVAQHVAAAANRNPRTIRNIFYTLRDIYVSAENDTADHSHGDYDIAEALEWRGLSSDGLPKVARDYLIALYRDFPDGAGQRTMQDILQAPGGLQSVERILMEKNLIVKKKVGRILTLEGNKRAKLEEAAC